MDSPPASDLAAVPPAVPPASPSAGPRGPSTPAGGFVGRWPFGLLAVVVLRLLNALGLILLALDIGMRPLGGVPIIGNSSALTRAIDLVLAGLIVVGVIGLLRFQRWGWVLTMVLVGISLVGELIRVAIGQPDYLGLLLQVLAAFYLNGRSVRALAGDDLDDDPRLHP